MLSHSRSEVTKLCSSSLVALKPRPLLKHHKWIVFSSAHRIEGNMLKLVMVWEVHLLLTKRFLSV